MRTIFTASRGVLMLVAVAALTLVLAAGCDDDHHRIRYSRYDRYPKQTYSRSVIVVPDRHDRSWDRRDRHDRRDRRDRWDNNWSRRDRDCDDNWQPRRDLGRRRWRD